MKQQIKTTTFVRDKQPLRLTLAAVAQQQRLRKDEAVSWSTFLVAFAAKRQQGVGR